MENNAVEKYGPIPITIEELKERFDVAIENHLKAKITAEQAALVESQASSARMMAQKEAAAASVLYTTAYREYEAARLKAKK